jgi:hypothetical protein
MDMWPLRALALSINFSVLGVAATVTPPPPEDVAVETTGVWLPDLDESDPYGTQRRTRQPRRVMALQRTLALPSVVPGAIVVAPERTGDTPRTWRVEELIKPIAVDHLRVALLPATE